VPFRIVITAAAVLLFDQAVFAGQFLAGTFGSLHTHRENATVSGLTVLGAAVAAVPIRWPGGGPIWPVFACLGLFGLIALQIVLGFARVIAVHVPLGVSIILLATLLAVRAWRPYPSPTDPPGGQRSQGDVPAVGREGGS
jgi:heme A synthase